MASLSYISPLDEDQRKEQFSRAYVHAIASAAGFTICHPQTDMESVDIGFSGAGYKPFLPPRLEAQLKCTSQDVLSETHLRFPLSVKNYNDLRKELVMVPRILIVLCVPKAVQHWIGPTEFKTVLKHSGYWFSLRGMPETSNTETVTVRIPRANLFAATSLSQMMDRVARGENP